jgi:hypothetical protein
MACVNEININAFYLYSRKGPIYPNESFLTSSDVRTVGTLSNQTTATSINIESEYLRLDDNTRDDKKTYDSIQNI